MLVVFGTRPEAVKVAPLIRALEASPVLEPVTVVTAQHRGMLDDVLDLFSITPDFDLDVFEPGQSLTALTARILAGLSPILDADPPDAAVVQGDTNTTFAGSLAAFYHQVPVVHLEAGLRTRDSTAPFPEEVNRRLTTQLTTLHLAATEAARANLLTDGVQPSRIVVTGNTVIDALVQAAALNAAYEEPVLERLEEDPRQVLLVTAHRRESWGATLSEIGAAVAEIAGRDPNLLVVLPVHRNPVVRTFLLPRLRLLENVVVVEPLPYGAFVRLMRRADVVLTDSGGIQEEAPSLGTPVLVMRDVTERAEAIACGAARLVGTERAGIVEGVLRVLGDRQLRESMSAPVSPYGDGRAASRALAALAHLLGVGPPATEFHWKRESRETIGATR